MLNDIGRKLDKADTEAIKRVAFYLKKHGQLQYARDMYSKARKNSNSCCTGLTQRV